jgi:hypothetical protein
MFFCPVTAFPTFSPAKGSLLHIQEDFDPAMFVYLIYAPSFEFAS